MSLVAGADQMDDAVPGDVGTGEGEDGVPVLVKMKEAPGNAPTRAVGFRIGVK